jgi:hypothetical protein
MQGSGAESIVRPEELDAYGFQIAVASFLAVLLITFDVILRSNSTIRWVVKVSAR